MALDVTTPSVVTPERYDQGLTYAEFLAQATVNVDKFEENYHTAPLTAGDFAFFVAVTARPDGPAKILALAEDWCGDVYRELPTIARIADATGASLRVFRRDEHPDIMDEFLSNGGKSRAIPVFVFYTRDHRYLTHFTERAAIAHAELADAQAAARRELQLPEETTFSTVAAGQRQAYLQAIVGRIQPRLAAWRLASIREMRDLMSTALQIPNVPTTD